MSATSTFLTALIVCATAPLWPFAALPFLGPTARRLALLLAVALLVVLLLATTVHLQHVVAQLTPPTDSLRLGSVSPPPYLDRAAVPGITKHAALFALSPQILLDGLRASLLALAFAVAHAAVAAPAWRCSAARSCRPAPASSRSRRPSRCSSGRTS